MGFIACDCDWLVADLVQVIEKSVYAPVIFIMVPLGTIFSHPAGEMVDASVRKSDDLELWCLRDGLVDLDTLRA